MTALTREQQREIGALKLATDEARELGISTKPHTIHVPADTLEWLVAEGGTTFRDYDAKTRRRMASEGRALPSGSFAIADCQDVTDAIRSIGRALPEERVAAEAHICKRVRSLRCTGSMYDNW
jgi:hypothetical protein